MTRSSALRASLALALSLALVSCGGGGGTTPALEAEAWTLDGPREAKTRKRGFIVSWASAPDPPPFNEMFELEFTVRELETDAPAGEDVIVAAELTMPQHGHGLVTAPRMSRREDGVYVLSGVLLHMQGEWVMRVRVVGNDLIDEAAFVLDFH